MDWVKEVVRFTGNKTGYAQNGRAGFFDPLIPDFLRLLPLMKIDRKFRYGHQTDWNLNFEQDKASIERFSAPRMDQDFQGAQRDRGTSVNDWDPGFVPSSWVLGGSFATEGLRSFGVSAAGNPPAADEVVFHSRESIKTLHARCDQEGDRLP